MEVEVESSPHKAPPRPKMDILEETTGALLKVPPLQKACKDHTDLTGPPGNLFWKCFLPESEKGPMHYSTLCISTRM